MDLKKIFTIYRKEMLDLLRDKRTVVTSVVIPLVLYPLIMIGFSSLMIRQESKMGRQNVDIAISDNIYSSVSQQITDSLSARQYVNVIDDIAEPEELIQDDLLDAYVELNSSTSPAASKYTMLQLPTMKPKR